MPDNTRIPARRESGGHFLCVLHAKRPEIFSEFQIKTIAKRGEMQ